MPFAPHTEADIQEMLATIGVDCIEQLFDEISPEISRPDFSNIPSGVNEMTVSELIKEKIKQDVPLKNFIGAGAYEHFIPAAVWDITSRGEFMTAYTPYQSEASQGTLQVIYEFQSMMTSLTGMDVSNASLYDGATALTEAILMALRAQKKSKVMRVLIPTSVHPHYRETVQSIVSQQDIELQSIEFDEQQGIVDVEKLKQNTTEFSVLVIPYPNFFGAIESVDALTDWAKEQGALVVAVANPMALALLKPPSEWGSDGADIVCGEAQPLGMPLASGGPYAGFLCCKKQFARQMPGRIVGKTEDAEGEVGYVLTLQAREQHIRRAKATSNICTNQGLLVTAATIYMSLLGAEGLRRVALASHQNTVSLVEAVTALPGVKRFYSSAYFHECVLVFEKEVKQIFDAMVAKGILPGFLCVPKNVLIVCATETKSAKDIQEYCQALSEALQEVS